MYIRALFSTFAFKKTSDERFYVSSDFLLSA